VPSIILYVILMFFSTEERATIQNIACRLQGETGPLGTMAMQEVARTMVARTDPAGMNQDWDAILEAYYACQLPSEEAVGIAIDTYMGKIEPGPYLFIYSREDRLRLGYCLGEKVIRDSTLELNFDSIFPGSRKRCPRSIVEFIQEE